LWGIAVDAPDPLVYWSSEGKSLILCRPMHGSWEASTPRAGKG